VIITKIADLNLDEVQSGYWALASLKNHRFDEDEMQNFQKELPAIFKRLQDLLIGLGVKDLSISGMVGTRYHFGAETRPIEDAADRLMEQLQGEIWAIQNEGLLLKVRQQIRDKRLMEYLNLSRSQRVADYLDRSYFKALDELRKLKEWRRKQSVIDIDVDIQKHPDYQNSIRRLKKHFSFFLKYDFLQNGLILNWVAVKPDLIVQPSLFFRLFIDCLRQTITTSFYSPKISD